jgi:hypothetical protein
MARRKPQDRLAVYLPAEYKPAKVVSMFKKGLTRVGTFTVREVHATMPRQWDYGLWFVGDLKRKGRESREIYVVLYGAENEASGNAKVDGYIYAMVRKSSMKAVIGSLISDLSSSLRSNPKRGKTMKRNTARRPPVGWGRKRPFPDDGKGTTLHRAKATKLIPRPYMIEVTYTRGGSYSTRFLDEAGKPFPKPFVWGPSGRTRAEAVREAKLFRQKVIRDSQKRKNPSKRIAPPAKRDPKKNPGRLKSLSKLTRV